MIRQRHAVALIGAVVLLSAVMIAPASAQPEPTLSVTPSAGLADRQVVTVEGAGFTSDDLSVVQCIAGHDPSGDGCLNGYSASPLPGAGFTALLEVRRHIPLRDPATGTQQLVDCAASAGACVVVGTAVAGPPGGTASVPLTFDPNADPLPAPTMSASKTTGLSEGDVVQIEGHHYPPNRRVGAVQCRAGGLGVNDCGLITGQFPFADASGDVAVSLRMVRVIEMGVPPDEPVAFDCGSADGACNLALVFTGDITESATTPLSFGTPATSSSTSSTTTTTTSSPSTTSATSSAAEPVVASPTFTG